VGKSTQDRFRDPRSRDVEVPVVDCVILEPL